MTPPNAASTGKIAARQSERVPAVSSRLISSPTKRKKTAGRPSENQALTVSDNVEPGEPTLKEAFTNVS